ncbi:MAG: phosphatidylserine/phosphatidylglycerophosphate/cardiolipin synthase family protein [Myxococcales bacterium]|nr:phosphatidylserine/phosphatidylglycerophosphate/cardiolipin synthase family protein [Myxococcales bacterium]
MMLRLSHTLPLLAALLAAIAPAPALADDASWYRADALQKALDRETRSRAYDGNSVDLLQNGAESFPRRARNVDGADVTLIKVYNFRDDPAGRALVARLVKRLRAGKQVIVQFDVKGSVRSPMALFRMLRGKQSPIPKHLQPILDHGGLLIPTNAPTTLAEVNPIWGKDHEKYFMTWRAGRALSTIMGGMNIGDEWATGGTDKRAEKLHGAHGFRDTDVEVHGPVNRAILAELMRDARFHLDRYVARFAARGAKNTAEVNALVQTLRGRRAQLATATRAISRDERAFARQAQNANMRFVANKRRLGPRGQYIEKALRMLMKAAPSGSEIALSNAFFLPTPTFERDLSEAARDKRFEMLLNGRDAVESGFRMVARRGRADYRRLMSGKPGDKRGIGITEWHGDDGRKVSSLHQKLWSFGKSEHAPFGIGSSNLDYHSLRRNSEGLLLIQAPQTKRAFDHMLQRDFRAPKNERLQRDRMPRRIKSLFIKATSLPRSWL